MLFFKKGISIIEVIIILVIISGLFFIFVSSFKKMNKSNLLKNSISQSIFVLNKARSITLSSKNDSQYGVHISNNKMTLFKGVTYNEFDPNNEEFVFDADISITNVVLNGGGVDVVFQKLTGETVNYGNFDFYSSFNPSDIETISIEPTGVIKKN